MPKKLPTNELAALSWIRSIPGVPSERVSTKLPGDNSLIAPSGFVTVLTVGGSSNVYVPRRSPVIQVQTWACHLNGDRRDPPWAKANQLAEVIREQCWDHTSFGGTIPTKNGYFDICVPSAYVVSEPMKLEDDEGRFACYTMDVQMHWTRRES